MKALEIIRQGTLNGKLFSLPEGQLERKLYQDVSKLLGGIGAKWSTKHKAFVFDVSEPEGLLEDLKGGTKRNLKQEFQFFETPQDIADYMVNELLLSNGQTVWEPSAGRGALIDAVLRYGRQVGIFAHELMPDNEKILRKKYTANFYFLGNDCLKHSEQIKFDRIIANPPFSKNQDIDHIRKMYASLAEGGRIVTVASTHWQFSSNKKETAFRDWLEDIEAVTMDLGHGRFKSSGTMVNSCLIIIDK